MPFFSVMEVRSKTVAIASSDKARHDGVNRYKIRPVSSLER